MLPGHYVTAHIAKQNSPKGHIAYYLVASQLGDLLWLIFHYLGLEPTQPDSFMDVSIQSLVVEMTYSHDVVPTLGWIGLTAITGRALFADWRPGLVGGALVAVHAITDYVGGYPHHLFGPESMEVGTGLYYSSPTLAVLLEAAFIAGCLWWILRTDAIRGVRRSRATLITWGVVYGGGVAFMILSAQESIAAMIGIESPAWSGGTAVPVLLFLYVAQIIALVWAESRRPVSRFSSGEQDLPGLRGPSQS